MTGVFKAKDIFQLVVNHFDDAMFSEDELIERGNGSGFHVLF
jgi:hypothetical protein